MTEAHPLWKRKVAIEMRKQDFGMGEIANFLGTSSNTVRRWVDPEYDEKQKLLNRNRKKTVYAGTCIDCGGRTGYSGGKKREIKRCQKCDAAHRQKTKKWTREGVIAAIQRWNAEFGSPPSSNDWNSTLARRERPDYYPASTSVYGPNKPFESWADAIEAAGFPRPTSKARGSPKTGKYWTKERVIAALQAHAKNGHAPSSDEWRGSAPDRPTNTWVHHLFGGWGKACEEAGLIPYKRSLALDRATSLEAPRMEFVKRVMAEGVPRKFVIHNLWQEWGFRSQGHFSRWLTSNSIHETLGWNMRPYRQMTPEEFSEARALR